MDTNIRKLTIFWAIVKGMTNELGDSRANIDYTDTKTLWASCGKLWVKELLKDMLVPASYKGDSKIGYFYDLLYDTIITNIDNAERYPTDNSDNIFVMTANSFLSYWNGEENEYPHNKDYQTVVYLLFKYKARQIISGDFVQRLITEKQA